MDTLTSFFINEFFVDPSRNQITHGTESFELQPKAMAVLLLLVQHHNEVVSHDTIMQQVWSTSVVSPNTLQRCIAQIRKALNDDSKQQALIKTHSKRGYSLVANISKAPANEPESSPKDKTLKSAFVVMSLIIFGIMTMLFLPSSAVSPLQLVNPKPITATDNNELNARYSPNGEYLAFFRSDQTCFSHIWIKHISSGDEFRVTQEPGNYGSLDWSANGQQLTFGSQNFCRHTVPVDPLCWTINTLDVDFNRKKPTNVMPRLACQTERTGIARWTGDNEISFIKTLPTNATALYSLDLITNQQRSIYQPDDRIIYSYDYHWQRQVFAIVSSSDNKQHKIEQRTKLGLSISDEFIIPNQEQSAYEFYNIHFNPNGQALITYTDAGVYSLDFNGQLVRAEHGLMASLIAPNVNDLGTKLVATLVNYDSDVVTVPINNVNSDSKQIIARSNVGEYRGKFSPNGEHIAFMSNRSGLRQLWLQTPTELKQISRSKNGITLANYVWAPSNRALAMLETDDIVIYDFEQNKQKIKLNFPVDQLVSWTKDNELTFIAENQLYHYSLELQQLNKFNLPKVKWAAQAGPKLWLLINKNQAYLYDKDTDAYRELTSLTPYLYRNYVITKNHLIYGIDINNQFWQYDIKTDKFQILSTLKSTSYRLNDVHNGLVLFTVNLNVKKELVEFDIKQ